MSELWKIPPTDVADPDWAAKRALASTLRELNNLCVTSTADAATLDAIRAQLDEAKRALASAGHKTSREAFQEGSFHEDGLRYVDQGAMLGHSNPVAAPLCLRDEGDRVSGVVTLHSSHGGAPGLVHGGIVATLLDEVLGHAAISKGAGVVTGKLEIRYHAPTPLHVPLRCEGWIVDQSGRRYQTAGAIYAGDTKTASAKGTFIDVQGERFSSLFENMASQTSPE